MQAALVHAIQPVHEAQDLSPPSPLPRGLYQLSKNHMRGKEPRGSKFDEYLLAQRYFVCPTMQHEHQLW